MPTRSSSSVVGGGGSTTGSNAEEGIIRSSSRRRAAAVAAAAKQQRNAAEDDNEEFFTDDTTSSAPPGGSSSSKQRKATTTAAAAATTTTTATEEEREEGCAICKQDNDHANLMLCEGCNGEYHIYCLNPPLEAVPQGDWFCAKCVPSDGSDHLEEMVNALPMDYKTRFNDICWSQGGVGYGWWPACIFNPCLAIGAARTQATKHLGKRHLVYFFHCAEAPFEIKSDSAILSWEMGLAMGYHMGRTAYAHGKRRYKQFQQALQAACIEESVPKRHRLKWTFADEPDRISKDKKKQGRDKTSSRSGGSQNNKNNNNSRNNNKPTNRDLRKEMERANKRGGGGKRKRSNASDSETTSSRGGTKRTPPRQQQVVSIGGQQQLVCEIFRRMEEDNTDVPLGTVVLPSQTRATFSDVRRYIKQELDNLPIQWAWLFWVPGLGPVSTRQESKSGNMMTFLSKTCPPTANVGQGTLSDPVRVYLVDAPKVYRSQEAT